LATIYSVNLINKPPIYGRKTAHKRKSCYYICRAKGHPLRTCRDERCPSRYIPAEALDALVWDDLCALLAHPESIAYALEPRPRRALATPRAASPPRAVAPGPSPPRGPDRAADPSLFGRRDHAAEYQRRRQDVEQNLQALATQAQQLDAQADHMPNWPD